VYRHIPTLATLAQLITMSITVAEKFFSRESADLTYIILGTNDDAAPMAALAAHAP
jgi:hypothetical protein